MNGDRLSKETADEIIDLIEQFATARGSRLIHARARLLAFINSLTVEPPTPTETEAERRARHLTPNLHSPRPKETP